MSRFQFLIRKFGYFFVLLVACSAVSLAVQPTDVLTCTTTTSGLWSETGTWTGCGGTIPDANDTCSIAAGHYVVFDDPAPITAPDDCAKLLIAGTGQVQFSPAATDAELHIGGNGVAVAGGVIITAGGSLSVGAGQSVVMNVDADEGDDLDVFTASGDMLLVGTKLATGCITDPLTFVLNDIEDGDFTIIDRSAFFPAVTGANITVRFSSGKAETFWFDVVSGTETTLLLDFESHGNVEGTETVQQPATAFPTDDIDFRTPGPGDCFTLFQRAVLKADTVLTPADYFTVTVGSSGSFIQRFASGESVMSITFPANYEWANRGWDHWELFGFCDTTSAPSAGLLIESGNENISLTNGRMSDSADPGASNRCHGIMISPGADPATNFTFTGNEIARTNDDALLIGDGCSGGYGIDSGIIANNSIHDIPRWNSGTSAQAIQMCAKGLDIYRNKFYDVQDDMVQLQGTSASPATDLAFHDNFIVNCRLNCIGLGSPNNGVLNEWSAVTAVNNLIGYTHFSGISGINNAYANFIIEANQSNSSTRASIRGVEVIRGNIIDGSGNSTGSGVVQYSNNDDHSTRNLFIESNIIVNPGLWSIQITWTTTNTNAFSTLTTQHNSLDARGVNAGIVRDTRGATGQGGIHTIQSNLFFNGASAINTAAATLMFNDFNGHINTAVSIDNQAVGASSVNPLFTPLLLGDGLHLVPLPGSTAATTLGHDGKPLGVRWAGIDGSRLPVKGLDLPPIINVEGTRDTDGDGIVDIWDNCDFDFNPSQLDTDGNGVGDACP